MDRRERQVGHAKRMIAPDHWARYAFVASFLKPDDIVLDAMCGCGYGAHILASTGAYVYAFDKSAEAIHYAKRWWCEPVVEYQVMDYEVYEYSEDFFSVVTCFEAIEHIDGPLGLLTSIHASMQAGGRLFISSPNEQVRPWSKAAFPYHDRHYTPDELEAILNSCGFEVDSWVCQTDKRHGRFFHPGTEGNTIIALARKR